MADLFNCKAVEKGLQVSPDKPEKNISNVIVGYCDPMNQNNSDAEFLTLVITRNLKKIKDRTYAKRAEGLLAKLYKLNRESLVPFKTIFKRATELENSRDPSETKEQLLNDVKGVLKGLKFNQGRNDIINFRLKLLETEVGKIVDGTKITTLQNVIISVFESTAKKIENELINNRPNVVVLVHPKKSAQSPARN